MTHVILTHRNEDELHIEFPTPETVTEYLATIRKMVPDRRWSISESWER